MRIKIIANGAAGYQLQRLHPNGSIANVRPASDEEHNLYQKLKAEMETSATLYSRLKSYEETVKALHIQLDKLRERQKDAEAVGSRSHAEEYEKLLLEFSNVEKRLEQQIELANEYRARAETAEAELSTANSIPTFQEYEAHNGR